MSEIKKPEPGAPRESKTVDGRTLYQYVLECTCGGKEKYFSDYFDDSMSRGEIETTLRNRYAAQDPDGCELGTCKLL